MEGKNEWVMRLNEEAQQVTFVDTDDTISRLKKSSIYRIPAKVLNMNREAYLPQWVSLGPYHHGEEHLMHMEEYKHRALLYTLKRSNQKLECFVQAVEEVVEDLLDSYQSIDHYWRVNRDAFVKLMILDGCFMLEILRSVVSSSENYPPSDPVFGETGKTRVVPYIKADMHLLENQLPLLLLEKLVAVEKEDVKFVHRLIYKFLFFSEMPNIVVDECLHLLHMFLWRLFGNSNSRAPSSPFKYFGSPFGYIGSAKELNQVGINFRPSRTLDLTDISFSKGTLRCPPTMCYDSSELLILNVIAFEQFHIGVGSKVTSYLQIMSGLVRDVEDVSLLRRQGIFKDFLSNDTTIVQFFNSISKNAVFDPDDCMYREIYSNLYAYRNLWWPSFRSYLINTYTRHWPVLSAAAAALIFILTITQAVYAVYSTYHI